MTPKEILAEVQSRFMVFLIDKPDVLEMRMRQALEKYAEKAGVILEVWQEEANFPIPPHCRSVIGACDTRRRFVSWRPVTVLDDTGETQKIIRLSPTNRNAAPYCIYYLADLSGWGEDENLPTDCVSLISDYLEALLAVQNYERLQNLYLVTGMHENVQNIPSQQELRQRITELETAMEENKAIVPPVSYF